MIEIWQECACFLATSQRTADQVRTIIKKGWFSDLEILAIHQKIDNERDINTISDTPSIDKQEQSNRNELPTSENKHHTTKQHRANTNTRTKNKFIKFKDNYEWRKDYLTISKKHRMENSQDGNGKKYIQY